VKTHSSNLPIDSVELGEVKLVFIGEPGSEKTFTMRAALASSKTGERFGSFNVSGFIEMSVLSEGTMLLLQQLKDSLESDILFSITKEQPVTTEQESAGPELTEL